LARFFGLVAAYAKDPFIDPSLIERRHLTLGNGFKRLPGQRIPGSALSAWKDVIDFEVIALVADKVTLLTHVMGWLTGEVLAPAAGD
jgi:hypothetical protein